MIERVATSMLNLRKPQTNVMANNMACNGAPNPTTPSDKIIPVKAGTNVSAVWRHTLECGSSLCTSISSALSDFGLNSWTE